MRPRLVVAVLLALLLVPASSGPRAEPPPADGPPARKIEEIQKDLRHFMPEKRMDAIRELQEIASNRAVDLIAERVREEKDWEVQIRALGALQALGNKRALETLAWAALQGEILLVRRAARLALKACDDGTALKRIVAALSPREPEVRARAMEAASELGGELAPKLIAFHFGDREATVQAAAAEAAGRLGDPAVIPDLLRLRRDRDVLVSTTAVLALARYDDPRVYPVLIEELTRAVDDYLTRRLAVIVATYPTDGITDAIEEAWPRLRGLGKARICRLLGARKTEHAVKLLLGALADREALIRADAARALGRAGQPSAAEPLLGLLKDPQGTVRLMALRALRQLLPPVRRIEIVRLALANEEPEIRVEGCVMAADDGLMDVLPEVRERMSEENWEVATAAMIAVGRLGWDRETGGFLAHLRNRDWKIRAAAVEGLFLLRHSSALPPLIDMTVDPHVNVRSAAVKSLQVLTQQKFESEPDKWRAWLEANRDTFAITKKGALVAGADNDAYGKDRYLVEILKKARLLVVLGKWDKVQFILDDLEIPYSLIRVQQLKTIGLNPKQLILFNCEGGGGVDRESTEALKWFVNTGGYVITTDWALQNVVKDVWPGLMEKWEKNTTRNDAVTIEPAAPDDPVLKGVFDRGLPLKWWLEIQAFAIEILDPFRVDVLVDSLEMMDRYSLSPMLARFSYGHGKVMNSVSHFYLQKEGIANLTTKRERMVFAADHLGLGFRDIRDLDDRGFFDRADTAKVTKDYSMFRLIVNFVDEKKKRVEEE